MFGFLKKKAGPEKSRALEPEKKDNGSTREPWIGVDLDGTLAVWDSRSSLSRIGKPVPDMLDFVKRMVENEMRVKIFTARANDPEQLPMIAAWLKENGLPQLEVTCIKDYGMQKLYDDRCFQVERNTGRIISGY